MAIMNNQQSANLVDILAGFSQNLDANRQYYDSRSDKYMTDIDKYTGKIQDVRAADYARQILQQQDQNTKQFQQDYLKTLVSEGQKNRDAQEVTLKTLSDTLKKFTGNTGGTGGVGGPKGDKPNQDIQSNNVDNVVNNNYIVPSDVKSIKLFSSYKVPETAITHQMIKDFNLDGLDPNRITTFIRNLPESEFHQYGLTKNSIFFNPFKGKDGSDYIETNLPIDAFESYANRYKKALGFNNVGIGSVVSAFNKQFNIGR